MAVHSSILVWRIPWTEEPGGLQFMELQKVGHGVAKSEQLIYTSIQMVVVFLNKKEKDLAH